MDAIEKYKYDNNKYGTPNSMEAMEKIADYLRVIVTDEEELAHLLRWLQEMRYVYHCELE